MKKIVILGSTGSVGTQTLEVVRQGGFEVLAISGYRNQELLREQAAEFGCEVGNPCDVAVLKEADLVVNAISGCAGIEPTYLAVCAGKKVALANKESLVSAGRIIMDKAEPDQIIPVDSEHSAIFQILQANPGREIKKIILTCSGGPFLGCTNLRGIRKADALAHPTWKMGPKITIDCATLMNKGLEIIEAKYLFDLPSSKIKVVIHPESEIHGMVEFQDGETLAYTSPRDMKIPIKYALNYPDAKIEGKITPLTELNYEFQEPDLKTFRLLRLAMDVAETEGTKAAYMNLVNEEAVQKFLNDKIKFHEIAELVNAKTRQYENIENPGIKEILELRV
jgi:1-deoxy-D-xylulose-5-phosphate reductoisomerase